MKDSTKPAPAPVGCASLFVRMLWVGVGPLALTTSLLLIVQRGRFSGFDLLYGAVVLGLLAARYLDITRFGGTTGDGDRATLRDWRRYAAQLLLVSGGLWGAVHLGQRLLG